MQGFTVNAVVENIPAITDFVNHQLETYRCPLKTQYEIDIAIDEIVSNVARYAYNGEKGDITVQLEWKQSPLTIVITFVDDGIAYDPLRQKAPDITLSAQERSVGGLGIFMVKNMMDEVRYERREDQNILSLYKKITSED